MLVFCQRSEGVSFCGKEILTNHHTHFRVQFKVRCRVRLHSLNNVIYINQSFPSGFRETMTYFNFDRNVPAMRNVLVTYSAECIIAVAFHG